MTSYCYVDIDADNVVQRVVIGPNITWVRANLVCADRWERCTKDTSSPWYPGPGWVYSDTYDRFIPPGWSYNPEHDVLVPPGWSVDPETGVPFDPNASEEDP